MGELGRKPNPTIVEAIKKWPAVRDLKDLQSFLGTTNYVRPHAGPAYARVASPLRALLKPDAVFPPNEEQRAALEGLKLLVLEAHRLYVPDERAAVEAAAAWNAGEAPRGRPYENGADTSKIAVGGVVGQCAENNGKLFVLLYFSAPLSPTQSIWIPLEQEFWGLLQLRREEVKHLGRIPAVNHTDHGNISRVDHLPLERVEAKHFRWHAEIVQGGSLLLYRVGTGALHMIPDGVSRNPVDRDLLILARIGEWAQHRSNIEWWNNHDVLHFWRL